MQSFVKVWVAIFIKHNNDMNAPLALQKLAIGCLLFELAKLQFIALTLFDGLLKGANKI